MSSRRAQQRAFTPRQRIGLVSLGVLVSAACSFSTDGITFVPDEQFDALAGGTSRSGSAGSASAGKGAGGAPSGGMSAGGAHSAGTGVDAGSDSGGEAGEDTSGGTAGLGIAGRGGSLNVAGSGIGGAVGVAGRPNVAGAPGQAGTGGGGPTVTVYPCTGDTPRDKLIADFTGITKLGEEWKGGSMGSTLFSVFGFPDPSTLKPNVKLGADDLVVEAYTVLQPVGAGIRISPCINLKGAQAIGFTMSGESKSGEVPMIAMRIYTNQNLPANAMMREGMCVPPLGQDPIMFCQPAHVDFLLPPTPTRLEFKFTDFRGGRPSDMPQLDQIKMIDWAFTSGPGQKPYDATFQIDDVLLFF
ncbi:MAG TPA: hypothetical protein VJV79_22510 [Polyangiaceae bacterium]|nr:hypothetical protein [Polyangiaceae bacterium]